MWRKSLQCDAELGPYHNSAFGKCLSHTTPGQILPRKIHSDKSDPKLSKLNQFDSRNSEPSLLMQAEARQRLGKRCCLLREGGGGRHSMAVTRRCDAALQAANANTFVSPLSDWAFRLLPCGAGRNSRMRQAWVRKSAHRVPSSPKFCAQRQRRRAQNTPYVRRRESLA